MRNAPVLVPGPLARLSDRNLDSYTELSPGARYQKGFGGAPGDRDGLAWLAMGGKVISMRPCIFH
jgi:hypothetical protein